MASQEQLAILRQGSSAWNEWRHANRPDRVDFTNANLDSINLSQAFLNRADFSNSDLTQANLTKAHLADACLSKSTLFEANLTDAILSGADLVFAKCFGVKLTGADLTKTDLNRADLTVADMTETILSHTILINTKLEGANLSGAKLFQTILADLDLTQVKGLDKCVHYGPSVINIGTLSNSGVLPLQFLRGCGIPERLFSYLPSLLSAGSIQFYSCFISYSTANQGFAERLHADLQNNGVRCWFAPHDIRAGRKIHEQIDEAIRVYDRLLLILSPESMASEWVATEIAKARKKEATQKRQVLFPISIVPYKEIESWELFDADRGKDSAREIREYFIPDFCEWKNHDTYTKAFDALLKALKS